MEEEGGEESEEREEKKGIHSWETGILELGLGIENCWKNGALQGWVGIENSFQAQFFMALETGVSGARSPLRGAHMGLGLVLKYMDGPCCLLIYIKCGAHLMILT